eukprot:scaffold9556_cov64-Phaeocystis_antarctica.AAC.1
MHPHATVHRQDRPRVWWANETRCDDGKRDGMCAPCVSGWFERWFEAEAQMLQGLAAQGVFVKPISRANDSETEEDEAGATLAAATTAPVSAAAALDEAEAAEKEEEE